MIRYPCHGPRYESRLAASLGARDAIPEGGIPFETYTCVDLHWHRRFIVGGIARCECGHSWHSHERPHSGACWVDDCDCYRYARQCTFPPGQDPMTPETYWAEWGATDHNLDVPVPDIERAIARHENNAADPACASGRDCDRAADEHYGAGGWPC